MSELQILEEHCASGGSDVRRWNSTTSEGLNVGRLARYGGHVLGFEFENSDCGTSSW